LLTIQVKKTHQQQKNKKMILTQNDFATQSRTATSTTTTEKKGFWGRLWNKVKSIASQNIIIGTIMQIGEEAFGGDWNGDGISGKIIGFGEDLLTEQERNLIDTWDLQSFTPFYLPLLTEAKSIFDSKSLDAQLLKANFLLNKICAYRSYIFSNPNNYSKPAHAVQNNYVADSFYSIEVFLSQTFEANKNISTELIMVNTADLNMPIIKTSLGKIYCSNYISKGVNNNPIQTNQTAIVVNGEVLTIPVQAPDGTFVNPATGETVANPFKKSYIVPGIAILLLGFAFLSGKKNKK
jgi:hypothetical protein